MSLKAYRKPISAKLPSRKQARRPHTTKMKTWASNSIPETIHKGRKVRRSVFYDYRRRIALERRRKKFFATKTSPQAGHSTDHIVDIEGDGPEPQDCFRESLAEPAPLAQKVGSNIPIPSFRKLELPSIGSKKPQKVGSLQSHQGLHDDIYIQRHKAHEHAERRARKREAELERYKTYIAKLKRESPELWARHRNS